jgi:hypothetical protein
MCQELPPELGNPVMEVKKCLKTFHAPNGTDANAKYMVPSFLLARLV